MQPPNQRWNENPLKRLAERSLEAPGMYLIALRAHLNRGQALVTQVLESVTEALPRPAKLSTPEE